MTHDTYDIRRGDHSSHVSFDSPERRSERKDLEEGAGGSARGKGIEGKRAPALKRMTLVHHWKDVVLPQLLHWVKAWRRLCPCLSIAISWGISKLRSCSIGSTFFKCSFVSAYSGRELCTAARTKVVSSLVCWCQLGLSNSALHEGTCLLGWVCDAVRQNWKWLKCKHGGDQMWSASFRNQAFGKKQNSFCSWLVLSAASAIPVVVLHK